MIVSNSYVKVFTHFWHGLYCFFLDSAWNSLLIIFSLWLWYLESGYPAPRLCALLTVNSWHKRSKSFSSVSLMFAAPRYAWPWILPEHLQEHCTIRGHGTMILPQATHFLHIESSAKPLRVGASSGCCKATTILAAFLPRPSNLLLRPTPEHTMKSRVWLRTSPICENAPAINFPPPTFNN